MCLSAIILTGASRHINCCWTSLNSYTSIVVVASLTIQITVGVVKILSGCGFGRC